MGRSWANLLGFGEGGEDAGAGARWGQRAERAGAAQGRLALFPRGATEAALADQVRRAPVVLYCELIEAWELEEGDGDARGAPVRAGVRERLAHDSHDGKGDRARKAFGLEGARAGNSREFPDQLGQGGLWIEGLVV